MAGDKTPVDIFIDGARKGWGVATNSIVPNVIMAFVMIKILQVTGLLKLLGNFCGPVMAIFGLPGEAVTVLFAAFMSMGGGVGVAAGLFTSKGITAAQVSILMPAIFLMGAQMQYMGRLLGTAEVQKRFYPALFLISIINALLSMLAMRFLLVFSS